MLVLIKGAGDLATGVAHRLKVSGFDVVMTEIKEPVTVRRGASFSQAIYDKYCIVEGVKAISVRNIYEIINAISEGNIPIIVDEKCQIKKLIKPDVVIDATIAKKNLGTKINDAKIVIALGPGFEAGVDCDVVIETQRGHDLGKVIYKGFAIKDTGIPGEIGGFTWQRIIRADCDGVFKSDLKIGDIVKTGQVIGTVGNSVLVANIDGVLRGLLQNGLMVNQGMKCGDIDPRCTYENCFTISDKARAIGGGVLEAILKLSKIIINLKK